MVEILQQVLGRFESVIALSAGLVALVFFRLLDPAFKADHSPPE